MKVFSYKSEKKELLFVLVPVGTDVNLVLPPDIKAAVGALTLNKEFELDISQPRAGLDVAEAIKEIQSKGYHINQAKITITTWAGGENGPIIGQREIPLA